VEDEIITGADGDNSINTGDLNKNINGKAGNDSIISGAGSDLLSRCPVYDGIVYDGIAYNRTCRNLLSKLVFTTGYNHAIVRINNKSEHIGGRV